jgi:hypothetical protein
MPGSIERKRRHFKAHSLRYPISEEHTEEKSTVVYELVEEGPEAVPGTSKNTRHVIHAGSDLDFAMSVFGQDRGSADLSFNFCVTEHHISRHVPTNVSGT